MAGPSPPHQGPSPAGHPPVRPPVPPPLVFNLPPPRPQRRVGPPRFPPSLPPAVFFPLPRLALPEGHVDAGTVVTDIEPVAHVETVAVERDGVAVQQVGDEQRDDLLGELIGPVV